MTQYGNSTGETSLDTYLKEIGKTPLLLKKREEIELHKRIKIGDQSAIEKLVNANLRFVVSVAKQYQDRGLPLSDLINEGNIGIIEAAKRFDGTLGFKFITYAVWWIRQKISEALAEQSRSVRLPRAHSHTVNEIFKIRSRLVSELMCEPTPEEIAVASDMSLPKVDETLSLLSPSVSLDTPVNGSEDACLIDVLESPSPGPEKDTLTKLLIEQIQTNWEKLTRKLNWREKEVIDLRFNLKYVFIEEDEPLTLEDIGKRYNLTRERVRQIEEKVLRKIRKAILRNIPVEERAWLLKQIRHDEQTRLDKSESRKKRSTKIPFDAAARLSEDDLITISARRPAHKAFSRLNRQEIQEIHMLVEKIKQKMNHFSNIEWLPFVEYYGLNVQKPKRLDEIGQEIGRHVSFVSIAKDRILRQLAGGERENFDALKGILEVYRYMRLRQKDPGD